MSGQSVSEERLAELLAFTSGPAAYNDWTDNQTRDLCNDLRDARARIAQLESALRLIADGSPPDEWKWRDTTHNYLGYGERGLPEFVGIPAEGDTDDAHVHGWAVGRWEAAKIARRALAQEGPC